MSYIYERDVLEHMLSSRYNVNRLISDFQALPLDKKIEQSAFSAINIVFGKNMETITSDLITLYGGTMLNNKRGDKEADIFFSYKGKQYLIEQKVRDDHDTNKRVGQALDFIEKKNVFSSNNSAFWFVEEIFDKNKKYYRDTIKEELYYGKEINDFMSSIFGAKGRNFFFDYKEKIKRAQREIDVFSLTFSHSIELKNISPVSLRKMIEKYGEEKISNYFFAGGDIKSAIETYSGKNKKKFQEIMELL